MPTLELLLDASGLQRGAQQAQTALRSVQAASTATETSVVGASKQLGAGMLSAATSIAGAATAFGGFNTAAGLFASSHALASIGEVARQMTALGRAAGGASTAFGAIGLAIRANPLGAIAGTLSLVASGMAVFASNTRDAANDFERLGAAMTRAQFDRRAALLLGAPTSGPIGSQLSGLLDLYSQRLEGRNGFTVGDVSRDTGIDAQDIVQRVRDSNRGAGFYATFPEVRFEPGSSRPILPSDPMYSFVRPFDPGSLRLSDEEARGLYRTRYDTLRGDLDRARGDERSTGGGIDERVQQQQAQARENMRALVAEARQFGAELGDAFFNVASGAQTARQAVAAMVADIARQASRGLFANLFGTAFGATAPQQQQQPGGWFSG